MNRFSVIAFTHRSTGLTDLQSLFIDGDILPTRLAEIKQKLGVDGLMYLATCNRVEFILSTANTPAEGFTNKLLTLFHPEWKEKDLKWAQKHVLALHGEEAVKHIFEVASSLDSLVVGEREIITQVRQAYEWSHEHKLTDDYIRILVKKTIETAKSVYTDTKIAEKPVSVMSLACRKLQEWKVNPDARILMVGAGQTADIMVKYLSKHGFKHFTVFNRTLKHAKELGRKYGIAAHSLKELETYDKGFDLLITCVQSHKPIITGKLFDKLSMGEKSTKVITDLGLPFNVDKSVMNRKNVKGVSIESLNDIAKKNLNERKGEMKAANEIIEAAVKAFYTDIKAREIELTLRDVPGRIQKIKHQAITSVFVKEIESLSPDSRLVLEKVMDYMEKKCISVPMQMAKEILLNKES
ncbi:MAG TPA: glutamyl-tRNA reductase [Bacteroidia bacterium]|nr:glutamyl-tRNA reductase [Bacteroidia bacterium]